MNGGTDGGQQGEAGSRRPSAANSRRPLPAPAAPQSEEAGKARMAQQMRDADVILTCDDDGVPQRPPSREAT